MREGAETAEVSLGKSSKSSVTIAFERLFDIIMIVFCGWFQFGLYLDGWAHLWGPDLETFFTPWHAVLYSGFVAAAAWIVAGLVKKRRQGTPWRHSTPAGYGLSLLGVAIFLVGGVADMVWHIVFGIDVDIDALVSPPHLLMALGSGLIVTGPLRAAWKRPRSAAACGWMAHLTMMFSLAFLLSTFTFFTAYAHPLARPWAASGNRPTSQTLPLAASDPPIRGAFPPAGSLAKALGVSSVLLQTVVSMGIILLAMERGRRSLPLGTLSVVFGVNAILMGFMREQLALVPAPILAGAIGDALLVWLRPAARPASIRIFAFVVPTIYYSLHTAIVMLTRGTWWSAHMIGGSIILAGIAGLLMSYLINPSEKKIFG